jgi:nucleoside 2-deoxyribosyltransferase
MSRYVIADFTGNRGGVYFEAGFAQGIGKPVIWLVDKADLGNVHFDTRQYNHIVYQDYADLKTQLVARIAATVPKPWAKIVL